MARQKTLGRLRRQIAKLQAKAEELEKIEKPGIAQLRALLRKYRLGPADIKIALARSTSPKVSKLRGRKVKPKFRNPAKRSETWTGRGRTPLWMVALEKKGKKRDDFLIKN